MVRFLRIPATAAGMEDLVRCITLAGGLSFPDGTNAWDIDWDKAALEVAVDNRAYAAWRAGK